MTFLSNVQIRARQASGERLISPLDNISEDASSDGPLEACAVKLRVGRILRCGDPHRRTEETPQIILKQGEMAFVITKETVNLPANIGGLMFPKSGGIAERGILITNTGHIDPGYSGCLRYAVINMGSELFALRKGDYLVKILFFELANQAKPSWSEIHEKLGDPEPAALRALGRDFAAIEGRMQAVAKKSVSEQFIFLGLTTTLFSAMSALLIALITFFFAFIPIFEGRVDDEVENSIKRLMPTYSTEKIDLNSRD